MIVWCFWIAASLLVYTYAGFPSLVLLRGLLRRRPIRAGAIEPPVTLIIVAHNEAASITAKLENVLALDYPRELLQIIVASDGSTDATNALVREFDHREVELLALPRQGKIAALNQAVASARGEVLVFSDANSMYAPDALRELVRFLADPQVGCVAGDQRYLPRAAAADTGERSYWNFDRRLKQAQSRAGSATSATGAIYALRRSLFQTVPNGVTDDFYVSTGAVVQGYRLVFALQAVAFEPAAARSKVEFGRKVRVMTRGLRAVALRRALLNPLRYGFYSVQILSHKVLRRLMFVPLAMLFVSSALLWNQGLIYQAACAMQMAMGTCALLGWLLAGTRWNRIKLFSLPFYFGLVNVACLAAVWNVLRGRRIDRWDPQREGPAPEAPATQPVPGGQLA